MEGKEWTQEALEGSAHGGRVTSHKPAWQACRVTEIMDVMGFGKGGTPRPGRGWFELDPEVQPLLLGISSSSSPLSFASKQKREGR